MVAANTIRMLSVYAHGYVAPDRRDSHHGGFGIQFGTGIFQNTVSAFDPLLDKFTSQVGIELVGCQVATQDNFRDPSDGATSGGEDLCWAIARAIHTGVRVSSTNQEFAVGSKSGEDGGQEYADPGPWEASMDFLSERTQGKGHLLFTLARWG
jgi:hypothetical protein